MIIALANGILPPQATVSAAETPAAAQVAARRWSARTSASTCEGSDDNVNHEVSFGGERRSRPKPIGSVRQTDAVDGHKSLPLGRSLRSEGEEERYLAPIQC